MKCVTGNREMETVTESRKTSMSLAECCGRESTTDACLKVTILESNKLAI